MKKFIVLNDAVKSEEFILNIDEIVEIRKNKEIGCIGSIILTKQYCTRIYVNESLDCLYRLLCDNAEI